MAFKPNPHITIFVASGELRPRGVPIYSLPAAGQAYFHHRCLLFGPRAAGKQQRKRAIPAGGFAIGVISGKLGSGVERSVTIRSGGNVAVGRLCSARC